MFNFILTIAFSLVLAVGITTEEPREDVSTDAPVEASSEVNLTGKWRVSGGRVNYVYDIEDYGNRVVIWQISQYGNSDRPINVTAYRKSGNTIAFDTYEDLGVGPTVSYYRLSVVNNNLLSGTIVTKSGSVAGLAPVQFKNRVTYQRTN